MNIIPPQKSVYEVERNRGREKEREMGMWEGGRIGW